MLQHHQHIHIQAFLWVGLYQLLRHIPYFICILNYRVRMVVPYIFYRLYIRVDSYVVIRNLNFLHYHLKVSILWGLTIKHGSFILL